MISALKNIGLTDSEIKVYLALLELGTSTKGPVVNKSGVASSKIYELLDKLIEKGLVSYIIKENRKYFTAADPSRIIDYLKEKQDMIKEQERDISQILPQLLLKQKLATSMKDAEIYKGIKGYQTAREKLLKLMKKGDTMLVIGAPAEVNDKIEAWLLDYHKRREKLGIGMKILYNENARTYGELRTQWKLTEVKYMSENIITPSWIEIFNDNVLICVLAESPLSFMIQNKDVADSFRSYFELLWNQKVTVFEGPENSTKFFSSILSDLKPGEEYFVLNGNAGIEYVPEIIDFFRNYHKERSKRGIKANFLFNYNINELASQFALPPSDVKFLPPDFKSPLQMTFYKDKLYISLWSKNAMGFLIQSQDIVNAFKAYYDTLWNQDTTVSKGFKAFEKAWMELFDELGPDDSYDVLGAAFGLEDQHERYATFFSELHKKRIQHGQKSRILFQPGAERVISKYKMNALYTKDLEYKSMPYKTESPVEIFQHKDKTLLLIQKKEPTVITINSKEVAESFRNHFDSIWNQDVVVNKGIENIYSTWWKMLDELNSGEEYYVLGANWQGQKEEVPKFFTDFHKKRIEKGVKAKLLFVSGTEKIIDAHKEYYTPLAEVKFLPKGILEAMQVNIYKNKVLLFVWREKEPIVFTIDDANVSKTFKSYFDTLWNQDVLTLRGREGITQLCESVMSEGSDLYFIGANFSVLKTHSDKFKEMSNRFSKSGLKMHVLCQESAREVDKFLEKDNDIRYLPKEFNSPMVIWVFGNKVAHVLWDELIVTIVENKRVADDYRTYFDMLWKSSKK